MRQRKSIYWTAEIVYFKNMNQTIKYKNSLSANSYNISKRANKDSFTNAKSDVRVGC